MRRVPAPDAPPRESLARLSSVLWPLFPAVGLKADPQGRPTGGGNVTQVTDPRGESPYPRATAVELQENGMNANMGTADRAIRFVVGLAILSLVFVLEGNARWWGLVGVGMLATGLFRFCPAYTLLGLNTCPMKKG